ncbi:MAG: hypothetical protein KDJ99_15550 [Candidatus Competibacteraceae bacterium]|nr:hypothetical protein [Candidatus Competibacteraceae bacterium]
MSEFSLRFEHKISGPECISGISSTGQDFPQPGEGRLIPPAGTITYTFCIWSDDEKQQMLISFQGRGQPPYYAVPYTAQSGKTNTLTVKFTANPQNPEDITAVSATDSDGNEYPDKNPLSEPSGKLYSENFILAAETTAASENGTTCTWVLIAGRWYCIEH